MDATDALELPASLVAEIVRHCASALPNEGCGLLSGRPRAGSLAADRFFPGTNRLGSPTRFEMEPTEVVAALAAIDDYGARLVAIVHSHPTTAAVPSRTDLREAFYPDALLLIVSLAGAAPSLRAWRILDLDPHSDPDHTPGMVEVAVRPI